jgi:hypothetical protein
MNIRPAALLIAAVTALLAVAPACADPGDGRFARRFWLRSDEAQSARAERFERRREFQERESAFGRMSPEERRQLRHDIRAAREDVYRRPPPPPPPPPGVYEAPSR